MRKHFMACMEHRLRLISQKIRRMEDEMATGAGGRLRNYECDAHKIALISSRYYRIMLIIPVMTFAPC